MRIWRARDMPPRSAANARQAAFYVQEKQRLFYQSRPAREMPRFIPDVTIATSSVVVRPVACETYMPHKRAARRVMRDVVRGTLFVDSRAFVRKKRE